jgi:hypothetical protein
MLTKGGSKVDGIFADLAELQSSKIPNGRRVELLSGDRYLTTSVNTGGILLASGNYANLVTDSQVEDNTQAILELQQQVQELLENGGSVIKLAPDLNYLQEQSVGTIQKDITGINATGGLTTVLELNGKHLVSALRFTGLTGTDTITVVLEVDGEDIFNSTWVNGSSNLSVFSGTSSGLHMDKNFLVESNMKLKLQTSSDTNVSLTYVARPIK